jgi:hypothetical protein
VPVLPRCSSAFAPQIFFDVGLVSEPVAGAEASLVGSQHFRWSLAAALTRSGFEVAAQELHVSPPAIDGQVVDLVKSRQADDAAAAATAATAAAAAAAAAAAKEEQAAADRIARESGGVGRAGAIGMAVAGAAVVAGIALAAKRQLVGALSATAEHKHEYAGIASSGVGTSGSGDGDGGGCSGGAGGAAATSGGSWASLYQRQGAESAEGGRDEGEGAPMLTMARTMVAAGSAGAASYDSGVV